jgi:hypothetical protein
MARFHIVTELYLPLFDKRNCEKPPSKSFHVAKICVSPIVRHVERFNNNFFVMLNLRKQNRRNKLR